MSRSGIAHGRLLSLLMVAVLIIGQLAFPVNVYAQTTPPEPQIITDATTGLARFVWYPTIPTQSESSNLAPAQADATAFFDEFGATFGLSDPANELIALGNLETPTGTIFRYQQIQQGVPVFGGEIVLDADPSGFILSAGGETTPALETPLESALSADTANQLAIQAVLEKFSDFKLSADDLIIQSSAQVIYDSQLITNLPPFTKSLAWQVNVTQAGDMGSLDEVILVDALNGSILLQFSASANALPVRTIYDCNNTGICSTILYRGNASPLPPTVTDPDVINAVGGLDATYLYFQQVLGRNGINGANGALNVRIQYNPDQIDPVPASQWANGSIYLAPDYIAQDVIAHEYTHGIIASTSKLINFDQSAVIAEGLSDLFSVMVDQYDNIGNVFEPFTPASWQIGETLTGGALRDIANAGGVLSTATDEYYCTYTPDDYYDNSNVITLIARSLLEDGETPVDISKVFYNTMIRLTSAADLQDFYYTFKAEAAKLGLGLNESLVDSTELYIQPCADLRGQILPRATTLMEPINNAVVSTDENYVTLKWREKADVDDYYLKVSSSLRGVLPQFTTWLENTTVCSDGVCSQEIDLLAGEKITWSVQTRNAIGPGPFTRSAVFTRATAGNTGEFDDLLVTPLVGSIVTVPRPGFSWVYSPEYSGSPVGMLPQSYDLSIYRMVNSTRSLFFKANYRATICSTEEDLSGKYHECSLTAISKSLLANSDYEWEVTARFGRTPLPVISDFESFTTTPLPLAPTNLTFNANGAKPLQPSLKWTYDPSSTPKPDQWKFFSLFVSGPGGRLTRTLNIGSDIICPVSTGTARECTFSFENADLFLEGGLHNWTVQAGNAFGRSAVIKGTAFTLSKPSNIPVLIVTETDTWRPLFSWNGDPAATSYLITLSGPSALTRTVKPADVCNPDQTACEFKMNTTLRGGNFTATVRAQNKAGYVTSAGVPFTLGTPPAIPPAPTLNTPATNTLIAQTTPVTLTWLPNSILPPANVQYQLNISGPGFKKSYLIDGSTCAATCSWAETGEISNFGRYNWTVNTLDRGIIGPASLTRSFLLVYPAPAMNPLNLTQNVFETPVSWSAVSGATSYRLVLKQTNVVPVKTVLVKTYTGSKICLPITGCSVNLPAMLIAGTYQVELTALGSKGTGLTSFATFTVAPYRWDDFNSNANPPTGWETLLDDGVWKPATNLRYWTGSIPKQIPPYTTIYTTESTFSSPVALNPGGFEVVTTLSRTGCTTCEHGINLNLNLATYTFALNGLGQFKVDTPDPAIASPQPWTSNSAVKRGTSFNTLRIRGDGTTLSFFINNRLVWQHTNAGDFSLAGPLTAGVYMYSDGRATNVISVDWLRVFSAPD